MREVNINNSSDLNIICSRCGTNFSSQARYVNELLQLYKEHGCV